MERQEEMVVEIREMLGKGETNPSAMTSKLYMRGFEGRFGEIRKIAEYQYKLYTMEEARKIK